MARKPLRKEPKRRPELDIDLHNETKNSNSLPDRVELILIQILRELRRLK